MISNPPENKRDAVLFSLRLRTDGLFRGLGKAAVERGIS